MTTRRFCKYLKVASMSCLLVWLVGCASTQTEREKIYTDVNPSNRPVRNLTSMNEALGCFDNMLRDYHVQRVYITSPGFPSRSGGSLNLGSGEDMIISTISRLNSDVFRYVNFGALARFAPALQKQDVNPMDPSAILQWIAFLKETYSNRPEPVRFSFPDYVIGGSISQLDESINQDSKNFGLNVFEADAELSKDEVNSSVTVDMYISDFANTRVLNGVSSVNSLLVTRRGLAGSIGARIKSSGIFFDASFDSAEGMHQAVRTLIELGILETLGQLAHVPYWQCLQIEETNPETIQTLRSWYDNQSTEELTRFAQERLTRLTDKTASSQSAYYRGSITGIADDSTKNAIARYQQQAGLVPTGNVDFAMYRKLMSQTQKNLATLLATASDSSGIAEEIPVPKKMEETYQEKNNKINMQLSTPKGKEPIYQVGEKLTFTLVVDQDAYVHCFIKNAAKDIYRILPNLNQSDDYVSAQQQINVPGQHPSFEIVFDTPTESEEIGCLASKKKMTSGWPMPVDILQAKPLPARTLQEVLADYRRHNDEDVMMGLISMKVNKSQ